MDANRIEANIDLIDIDLNILSEKIQRVPTNFVFNIDEVGNQDYADAEIKTLIAPVNYEQLYAYYPISRNRNRSSLIAAISPCGMAWIPQVTITRATLDDDIYDYFPLDSAQIVHTDNGYVNTRSFENCF